jgi:hypothetical protein
MALVNIETAGKRVISLLRKNSPPFTVEILTYKRNRGVVIVKLEENVFELRERGYQEATVVVAGTELEKTLKTILKRECPRSRKVRLYQVDNQAALPQKRKEL